MAGAWTNNWKGVKNWMLLGPSPDNSDTSFLSGWDTIRKTDGNVLSGYPNNMLIPNPLGRYYNVNGSDAPSSSYIRNAIVFGSGSGTPDATDYCLAAKWTADISRVSLTQSDSYDDATHTKTKTVTCTVQNTGSAAVTIREWGIETCVGGSANHVLLYRALLDTPVTLQQYESATFTCTVSLRLTDPS